MNHGQAQRHRFEVRLEYIEAAGIAADSVDGAGGIWLPARAALAGQQGQHGQAVTIGRALLQFGIQRIRRAQQVFHQPLIDVAAFAGGAADQGHIGADQVAPKPGRQNFNFLDDAQGGGGADGEGDLAGGDRAGADVGGRAIAQRQEKGDIAELGPAGGVVAF